MYIVILMDCPLGKAGDVVETDARTALAASQKGWAQGTDEPKGGAPLADAHFDSLAPDAVAVVGQPKEPDLSSQDVIDSNKKTAQEAEKGVTDGEKTLVDKVIATGETIHPASSTTGGDKVADATDPLADEAEKGIGSLDTEKATGPSKNKADKPGQNK